jgi:hypothetical protein
MKRTWMAAFVLLISLAFVSAAFAQAKPADKPAAEKPAATPEKAKPAEKPEAAPKEEKKEEKAAEKPKPKLPAGFIGVITGIDNTAQLLMVKGAKDAMVTVDTTKPTLKGYKSIEEMKVGDKIAVKYAKKEGVVITKIAAAKPATKEKAAAPAEKKEKPAAKKSKKFEDVDANKDGKITIEELTVVFINISPEAFKQFDKNGDGALDKEEFKAVK